MGRLAPIFQKGSQILEYRPRALADVVQSETFNPPSDEIAAEFPGVISEDLAPHGTDGPVDSSFSNFQYPVIRKPSLLLMELSCRPQPPRI